MFQSISDDFDRRHATGLAVAVLLADATAVLIGVAWLVAELLMRVAWYLLSLLLAWWFPPALTMAYLPTPPITVALTSRVAYDRAAAAEEVREVEVIGDWDWDPTPDPVITAADLPPDPSELRVLEMLALESDDFAYGEVLMNVADVAVFDEVRTSGMLALLGSSSGDELSNVFGSDDSFAIGGLIGSLEDYEGGVVGGVAGGTVGIGGLGSRGSGLGGGGTAEGLGGLGVIGRGAGDGPGQGYGTISGRKHATVKQAATPEIDTAIQDWLNENGTTSCSVTVRIDELGAPISATASGCPRILTAAAVDAAMRSTFEPSGSPDTVRMRFSFRVD
jgi:hypothetical protein